MTIKKFIQMLPFFKKSTSKKNIEKRKNILYVFTISILTYILYREYTYEIPYNYDYFVNELFSFIPIRSTYSWTWIFLLGMSILGCLPLFKKKLIGIIGLLLFIGVIIKPFIIKETPEQSSISFFKSRKNEMYRIIQNLKKSKQQRIINKEIENLGFEQLEIKDNTYIFMVRSLLDNGYGFLYSRSGKIPLDLYAKKIEGSWYTFSLK